MNPAFELEVARVVGTPVDGFWSQVHTFSPQDTEKKEKRGELLVVLVITGVPEGVESVAAGREVLSRLHEEYYGNLNDSAFEKLRGAIEKIGQENDGVEIIVGVLLGEVLYLSIFGGGQVLLKRGEKLGVLLKGSEESGTTESASGILQEKDILVLGSGHFFEVVSPQALKNSLESNSPNEAVEALAPDILGGSNMGAAAAILALAQSKEELEISPVAAEEEPVLEESPITNLKTPVSRGSFWGKIKPRIRLPIFKKQIFVRDRAVERKKKFYFLAAILLLALLGVSLVFGLKRRAAEEKKAQARELIKRAEEQLNEGKILAVSDFSEGKVLGEQAAALANEAMALSQESQEAAFVKSQVEEFLASLGQEVALNEPKLFMDLGLIEDGARGEVFALEEGNLVIWDQAKAKIYFLNLEKKSNSKIDFLAEKVTGMSSSAGKTFILTEKGVETVSAGKESAKLAVEKEESWEEVVGMASYLGHLYLLDPGAGAIWRYLAGDSGFGPAKNWFVGTAPNLSQAVDLTIDGAIWVLEKEGITKLNLGQKESFALSKMPEEFGEPAKIFTNENTENLYVLDKGKGKVFVIDKEGNFKVAYSWEGFKRATDLVALESAKKVFILLESKIYEIALK